ncbi:coproporphyrinogen III oxidase [Yangia mangrovi]|uniref:Heme chaperone HemW n=1 Tax=Alloyangia mangrovi TaxID=1779329 RepID=A0A2A3JUU2_9RHOB|nr:radical SAM family heme chaperone HemW [Alloyangia mangrovi]MCT4369743.1 coproporphyrinogen III oxidase [Alloyangia mangrovi]
MTPEAGSGTWREGGFGLYVHWPFCEAKCPYCDFNSHVVRSIDQTRWADALSSEVRRYGEMTSGRILNSIYFGGGTPSLMEPATVQAVLDAAKEHWTWANDIEITLEANPRSVEVSKFEGFHEAGVNRVSMGIQSLRPDDLRRLGRLHDVDEAIVALETAKSVFKRVNFDLIYARENQTLKGWETELREALDLAADHLSLYQLTIEEGTMFWERAQRGQMKKLPDEDLAADMFLATQEITSNAGYAPYEVSNHALPGAQSRHNLVYWRGGDYVGVGPGAHGRVTVNGIRHATEAWKMPGAWIEKAEAGRADSVFDPLGSEDIMTEFVMMGLRLSEGISLSRLAEISPKPLPAHKLTELRDLGLIWRNRDLIGATTEGRLVLNGVISELLTN